MFVKGALWQPFTYLFIHSSLSHLFFNMLWLYIFGPEVEIYFTKKRFITFYLFCGVISVLVNFIPFVIRGFQPPIIGASGSIMAVLIAFAYINPEREFILFPLPIPINARGIVILVILMNLFYGLDETQYSVLTHFAGMGIGYLYISADYLGIIYKIKKILGLNKFDVI
ncbi:MAG: rhomboid family intramembrane serine protease [Candidatus Hydrogenedens sp.]